MNIFKLILFTLSAGLLYTNTSLMHRVRDVNGWLFVFLILFALTYSVISSLTLYELRSRFLTGCFAVLDGVGIYMDFAGDCTNKQIGLYFGIYTALFSVSAFLLKGEAAGVKSKEYKDLQTRFDIQLRRAQKLEEENRALRHGTATDDRADIPHGAAPEPLPPQTETEPRQIAPQPRPKAIAQSTTDARLTEEETEMLKRLNKAFNRMKDEDRRRQRIKELPTENLRAVACEIYNITF